MACVNFLAGVPDRVLAGSGIDGALLDSQIAVLRNPADEGAITALAEHAQCRPTIVPRG